MAHRSFTTTQTAVCLECTWQTEGRGAQGRAAQHHDRTRHRVTATQVVEYDVDRIPTDDQETLIPRPAQEQLL